MKELSEMQAAVRSASKILPQGSKTNPGLLSAPGDTSVLPTENLNGIVTYDPSEFLITAGAGTPLQTLVAALEQHGQYLPFDPMWGESGSTIGGAALELQPKFEGEFLHLR
ncbi:MAG: FAD-dependent oxidoreductase [Planctomycetota bacterium]